jgi:alkanesulfonate monooxygenase SsuD/methylene tetrahydromethanopterin reductase-like flavin-dependent oxidoreductase (luciferase family)
MLALAAMDMDVLTRGRFRLGLGVAHAKRNNDWYAGHDAGKPVSQMREYLDVVRLVMERAQQGGELRYEGEFYNLKARQFFSRGIKQPRPLVPIYIAAVKPKMVALAAERAEGLIGNPLFSPRYLRDVVVPAVREGIMRSGRHRQTFEVLGQCFTVIENDQATAYRIGASAMLFSIWARIYDAIFVAHGFGEVLERVHQAQRSSQGDPLEQIPREMVDAFCAVGPIDRVRAKLQERDPYMETAILAVPATGTTVEQQSHYRARILEEFAG